MILLLMPMAYADKINSTQADGLIGYEELNSATPLYRTYNESNDFSDVGSALETGVNGTNDITWNVIRANHERDEIIIGTEDKGGDVNIQIFSNNAWSNLLEVSSDIQNSAQRSFDIAYEDLSGDALIVYENSTDIDNYVNYRIWNGTGYSQENIITVGFTDISTVTRWIDLTPKKGDDKMMLLIHNNVGDLYAIEWNGTGFDTDKGLEVSTGTTSNTEQHFAFGWEESSGQGILGYGSGTNFVYRTYDTNSPYWSIEATIGLGNGLGSTRMCSEPDSDYIGVILQDGGNDVNAMMWTGTSMLNTAFDNPTQDDDTEPNGADNANADCVWVNSSTSYFGFVDTNLLSMDYFTFTKANTWSTSDLTSTYNTGDVALDDISALRFVKHPTTEEFMVITQDLVRFVNATRWDGIQFLNTGIVIEDQTEVITGNQESAMFGWYRYDPVPDVTNINTNITSTNFNVNDNILINVTVTDNIDVSTVLANISLPRNDSIVLMNLTKNVDGAFEGIFSTTDQNGNYTLQIIANDTSVHNNINYSEETSFLVGDAAYPNVTLVEPPEGNDTTTYPRDSSVNLRVDVSDDIGIDSVLANITFPNGSIGELEFYNLTTKEEFPITFEQNETDTVAAGGYSVRFIVNDTSDNVNFTATTIFFIDDSVSPLVFNLNPIADTNYDNGSSVEIGANFTDNLGVGTILANITLPNGTVYELLLNNETEADYYNATFDITDLVNYYNITFIANDTVNNLNQTETTNFSIGDFVAPEEITLNSPDDEFNISSSSLDFNFTVIDDKAPSLNCSLMLNNNVEATNLATLNNTLTNFQLTNILDNKYEWNVTCADQYDNYNTSNSRTLRIDNLHPNFISITTIPGSTDELDPGVNVTVLANVTEDVMDVDSVILEYKNSSVGDYVNLTMSLVDGFYNVNFNATDSAQYFLRVHANDTLNNVNVSAEVNITVETENTWTRTPTSFGVISESLGENKTIGTLIINNTGDFALDFNVTSDYSEAYYNDSVNFNLGVGEEYSLIVNASTSTSGTIGITLTINGSNGDSLTTTGTLIVAPNQPVLVSTFLNPIVESLTLTRGDQNVEFRAGLNNTGEGNATNLTFFIDIPDDWIVTFGEANVSIDSLISGESSENIIEVNIPSNATTGTFNVIANSTGFNDSGSDLEDLGLIFGDTVVVSVNSESSLGASTSSTVVGGSSTSNSGVSSGGTVGKSGSGETIYTTETVAVVRGSKEEIPITISNVYENAYLENVNLEVQGFMSQYIRIQPVYDASKLVHVETKNIVITPQQQIQFYLTGIGEHTVTLDSIDNDTASVTLSSDPIELNLKTGEIINLDINQDSKNETAIELKSVKDGIVELKVHRFGQSSPDKLYFGEGRNYLLDIFAPAYLEQEDYTLTVKITADVVAVNPALAGFSRKPITEFRKLVFKLFEVSGETLNEQIEQAKLDLEKISELNVSTTKLQSLLSQAEVAFNQTDYKLASDLIGQLNSLINNVFEAKRLFSKTQQEIDKAKSRWLKTTKTEEALGLALKALEREDFETALERAKEAQLVSILELKGKINILWFITFYWWAIIIGAIILLVSSFVIYKKLILTIIAQRLKNLSKEEISLESLKKEAQYNHLKEGSISSAEYHKLMAHYETRLNKIKLIKTKLSSKRVGILKTEQEIENIEREEKELYELMKKVQMDYFENKSLSRNKFKEIYGPDRSRLAEIQEEKELLREKLENEKISKKYKVLRFVNNIYIRITWLFRKKQIGVSQENVDELLSNKKLEKKKEIMPRQEKKIGKPKARDFFRYYSEAKKQKIIPRIIEQPKQEKKSELSQNPEAKKRREEVYKMLKEKGVDVKDE